MVFAVAVITYIVVAAVKNYNTPHVTHGEITDKEILNLISSQIDGLLSADALSKLSSLSLKDAKARLNALTYRGLIATHYTSALKSCFSLKEKLADGPYPTLSEHPFLTLSDLMVLFKHFNYRLSLQDICLATNLPVAIIESEMKYFIKEKVVDKLSLVSPDGMTSTSNFYMLNEPYRNNPDAYVEKEEKIDQQLSMMYERMVRDKRTK